MGKKIILKQGDTLRKHVTLTYTGTGNPVDLTGYTGYCQLRQKPGSTLLLSGTVTTGGAQGTVVAVFTAAQTNTLALGTYGFDIRIESDDDRKTIYTAEVEVVKPYTERS